MKETDELFTLVHSMDKNERGYFKKFAGINGQKKNNIYIRLFDCINQMKTYSTTAIRDEFSGEKMLSHLAVSKHYLKNMILRALRNYHEENMLYVSNNLTAADVQILVSKGLYQSALKRVLKEKQTAVAREDFLASLQWLTFLDRLADVGLQPARLPTTAQVLAEKQKVTEQFLNYHQYVYLLDVVISLTKQKKSAGNLKKLNGLIRHPLLSSVKMPLSNTARIIYTQILIDIYRLQHEREKGIQTLKEQIAFFEDPKSTAPRKAHNLLLHLNTLLNFMGRAETIEMRNVIDKYQKTISVHANSFALAERTGLLYGGYIQEMRLFLLDGTPGHALHTSYKLEYQFKKVPPGKEFEMAVWILKSMAYIALSQFHKALDELNILLNSEGTDHNYLLIDAHILNIIVHIKLGNFSILKRQFTIAVNFVRKISLDAQTELWILSEIERVAKAAQAKDEKALRANADIFLKTLKSKRLFDKEYLEDWLNTKI